MSELTQTLKILVSRYPGTMAELARRAAVDRSTLYKILSGQRRPREEQLYRLADALELPDDQRADLLQQYKRRGRSTDPRTRDALHRLLETAFRVDEYTRGQSPLTNPQAAALPHPLPYAEGTRAVSACASALVAEYLLSGDTRPLLLSPFSNTLLDRVLIDRFAVADGAPVPVCQLLLFTADTEIPRAQLGDMNTLNRTLPFLFLPKMVYEARVVRHLSTEPTPGTLMPVYLLLPEKALFMDQAGQKCLVVTDREAVQNLRLSFSRKFITADTVLKLATDTHDFSDSLALYRQLFAAQPRCSMVRCQPPFSLFADAALAKRVLRPEAAVPAMLDYLSVWTRQTPDLYFCEEGLLDFVRTGAMYDLPPALYTPPDTATRRELLLRLQRAAASDRRTLRIVDASQLALTPTMSVNVFEGRGVVFCQAVAAPDAFYCREYLMEDPLLTDAMLRYLDDIRATDRIRSQKYTLDFIDYCLRLL